MLNETIAIYAIIDDLLNAIRHRDDCRRKMSDAEIITTAMVAALFFNGNQLLARAYLKEHGLIPKMPVTAQLRSQIIIGAAGGNFAASQETLKAYLDTVSAELGIRQLILYPDAGCYHMQYISNCLRFWHELCD